MRERDRGYISNQGNGKRERGREEEKGILSNQVVLDYTFSIYWETGFWILALYCLSFMLMLAFPLDYRFLVCLQNGKHHIVFE